MFTQVIISTLTSTAVVGLGVFILKVFFKATFEKWISHQFNLNLENAKSALRKEEDQLRAEFAAQEKRLESLKSAALSGMAARNQVVDTRRMEALERLWNGVIEMRPLRGAARFTESLKMDALIARASNGDRDAPKVQQFADMLWKSSGLENFKLPDLPDRERPFVSVSVWSLFSAYRQFLCLPMAQLSVAKLGFDKGMLVDPTPLLNLAKAILPHFVSYIDQYGVGAIPYLLDEVENKLLAEITRSLEGSESDASVVQRALEIQRAAEKAGATPEIDVPDKASLRSSVPPPS